LKLNIKSNSLWALAEVVSSALLLFFVYRLVVHQLGIAALGVWSIVLATTSVARIVDPGASTGLGRYMALAHGRRQPSEMGTYFVTTLVSTLVFYIILSVVIFWPLREGLRFAVSGTALSAARHLLPYAIVSFLLMNVNAPIQGSLIGLQRSDQRSQIMIVSLLLQLLLASVLVPKEGLVGLAEAQIGQYFFAIIVGYFVAVRHIHGRFALLPPFKWKVSAFRELLVFGSKLQAITISSFVYEPASKFVISWIAGVETLGLYEMAQKFVAQVRQLIVGPTLTLMPAFAHLHDQASSELVDLYRKSLAATTFVGSALMGAMALSSPIVSVLWLGRVEGLFVAFIVVISSAWLINIFAAPAYILALGIGVLRWNFWGNVLTAIGSPLLALMVCNSFGAIGVVSAIVFPLAAGSLLSMIMNCRAAKVPVWTTTSDLREFVQVDLMRFLPGRVRAKLVNGA
jgi:O-antigen/teichoic acid export membrane protein